jgi:hypothetical protein
VLEELIGQSDDSGNAIDAITRAGKARAIRLAVDEIEPHTKEMQAAFATEMDSAYAEVAPSEQILDLLWNESERPAVLAIVGHLETKDIAGEPLGPRIVPPGKKAWLRADDIIDRVGRKGWERQPHSLILLMGCETGLTELGTLKGFVTALSSAPAAAAVGTGVRRLHATTDAFCQRRDAGAVARRAARPIGERLPPPASRGGQSACLRVPSRRRRRRPSRLGRGNMILRPGITVILLLAAHAAWAQKGRTRALPRGTPKIPRESAGNFADFGSRERF